MKIQKAKRSKIVFLSCALAALLAVGVGAYYAKFGTSPPSPDASVEAGADTTETDAPSTPTEDSTTNTETEPTSSSKPREEAEPSTPAAPSDTLSVQITNAQQDGSTLQVRTLIDKILSSGTCELTLSKSGETTVTKKAGIQQLPASSTCKGFNIDVSDLSTGLWNITVKVTSGGLSGSAKDSVTLR